MQIKKILVFLLICLINNLVLAQRISNNVTKYYEFELCDSPYTISIFKSKKNKFWGFVDVDLEKKRKNSTYKKIKSRIKINPMNTQKIFVELNKAQIDSVTSNYDDDSLTVLDGDYLAIKILRNKKIEKIVIENIYPVSSNVIEKTPLRIKVQNWLTILDNELNLKNMLSNIKSKLKKGTYCYSAGAIYTNCIDIK